MKKIGIILSMFVLAISCTNSTTQETQNRKVSGFSEIHVSKSIKVTLTMCDTESVEVTAPENYINKVITELNGNDLQIYIKGNNHWNKGRKVEVKVMAKNISKIKASSGSALTTTNKISNETLSINVSSGAQVNIICDANYINAEASSGARSKIKGQTEYLNADASSGSHISAYDLNTQSVKAHVSSGASIKVNATKEIKAEASSGGSIKYSGSPKMKDIEKSSGGSVKPM